MAELAVTDGRPPPGGLPDGELSIHRVKDDIWIAHADPRILISGELLDAINRNGVIVDGTEALALNAWLDTAGCKPGYGYIDAVLHIDGVNRQVIYRIVDIAPRVGGYVGEWPD